MIFKNLIRTKLTGKSPDFERFANRCERLPWLIRGLKDRAFTLQRTVFCSDMQIDVVISSIEKDLAIAALTIDSVGDHVMHPVHRIFLAAPPV